MLEEIVNVFRQRGDEQLHYVDGLDIFGPNSIPADTDMKVLMPDDLHPDDNAQQIIADNVTKHVVRGAFGYERPVEDAAGESQ